MPSARRLLAPAHRRDGPLTCFFLRWSAAALIVAALSLLPGLPSPFPSSPLLRLASGPTRRWRVRFAQLRCGRRRHPAAFARLLLPAPRSTAARLHRGPRYGDPFAAASRRWLFSRPGDVRCASFGGLHCSYDVGFHALLLSWYLPVAQASGVRTRCPRVHPQFLRLVF